MAGGVPHRAHKVDPQGSLLLFQTETRALIFPDPSTVEDQLSRRELCKAVSLAQSPFSMEECKADSLKRCRCGQGEEAAHWNIKDIWRNFGWKTTSQDITNRAQYPSIPSVETGKHAYKSHFLANQMWILGLSALSLLNCLRK